MKSILTFALIPLILSMGIISVLQVDLIQEAEALKSKGNSLTEIGSKKVCGDRLCVEIGENSENLKVSVAEMLMNQESTMPIAKGLFPSTMDYTITAPEIDPEKGYFVTEIADGLFWLIDGGYQMMFLTTGQGVIVVDAPRGMGEKILSAISDVTNEPITHVIYSHIHKDHIGSAHIYPDDAMYIAHSDTSKHLKTKNDPDRPIPTKSFDDTFTLSVGDQILELSYEGSFHSKGDIVILAPKQKVAMVVDLFHPNAGPFLGFGITTDMNAHLAIHDILLEKYDFEVLISAHEQILATKDHLKTNKQFVLDVMANVVESQQMINYGDFVERYGSQGQYAIYANYFDAIAQTCAELTLEDWQGKLNELEPFMKDHCRVMNFYVSID